MKPEASRWVKHGLVYAPDGRMPWARHSALQPTPLLRDDETIRVFVAFRDDGGVGRVAYVDLSADDPPKVIRVSERPVLDVGRPGAFDENGVVPCAIIARGNELLLYYAGYSLGQKVRFLAFSGLAISRDGGETFQRLQETPIFERSDEGLLFRAIHCVRVEGAVWHVWYGAGSEFYQQGARTVPSYSIRYLEAADGKHFPATGVECIRPEGAEYRVGRPQVFKENGSFKMYFCASTREQPYRLAAAHSPDGKSWTRTPSEIELHYAAGDFDSEMSAYPAVVRRDGRLYLFYNGNDYGRQGFGLAERPALD